MTYQTLYRKYRSNDLNELIGQDHIIKTLTNAIAYDRLSHAYIFSGPRGTGKTSTARILAKMVNKTVDDMATCEICSKISQGSCVDVIEIDAASHTGVDYMRQLIEQVQFLPVEAKYKVFIIDEVHMLSTGAFNALLKTLEEPPQQILFILATTELHKIPATIQSRSQTLHFRLIEPSVVKNHMITICKAEGYEIDPSALDKIVHVANGGMRDALSLLDQLMSVSENKIITLNDVAMILGTVDDDKIIAFLTKCFNNDQSAHTDLHHLLETGVDVFQFYDDIIHYLHHHFLLHQSHSFNVPDHIISAWLMWFCDQLSQLKLANDPALVAQISLFSEVQSLPNTVNQKTSSLVKEGVKSGISDSRGSNQMSGQNNAEQPAQPVKADIKPPQPQGIATPDLPISKPDSEPVNKPNTMSSKDDTDILNKISQQFPVLKPVISGATLMEKGGTLCLVLEETYQFFERKLSEDKFKQSFLSFYNQSKGASFTEWHVTTDVNTVYQLTVASNDQAQVLDEVSDNLSEESQKTSKTVNQIIEMFEGQIIQ